METLTLTDAYGTEYSVNFNFDEEAAVWTATSDDIVGLVLESDSLNVLIDRVLQAVPELLELNQTTAFWSDENQRYLRESIRELDEGRGQEHDLIFAM